MPRGTNRYDEALRQGRLWTPAVLRSRALLEAWYEVGDLATVTAAAGAVSAWADKSGRGRTLTTGAGAGNGGTLSAHTFQHRPSISFGLNQAMAASMTLTQPFTVFVVFKHGTRTGSQSWLYANADT